MSHSSPLIYSRSIKFSQKESWAGGVNKGYQILVFSPPPLIMKAITRRFLYLHIVHSFLRISHTTALKNEIITMINEILTNNAPANIERLKKAFFIIFPFLNYVLQQCRSWQQNKSRKRWLYIVIIFSQMGSVKCKRFNFIIAEEN